MKALALFWFFCHSMVLVYTNITIGVSKQSSGSHPSVGNYTTDCIKLNVGLRLTCYEKPNITENFDFVQSDWQESASCHSSNKTQTLILSHTNGGKDALTMQFEKGKKGKINDKQYGLTLLKIVFDKEDLKKCHKSVTFSGLTRFVAPLNNSYSCANEQALSQVYKNQTLKNITLSFYDLQVEAFRTKNATEGFSTAHECAAEKKKTKTSDVVPIAVGSALAALVLVVLIAYVIGRVRAKNEYETV